MGKVSCSACKKQVPSSEGGESLPEAGLILRYPEFGYYDGFYDFTTADDLTPWTLCHDCVIKLLDTFPKLKKSLRGGLHPCNGDVPCCEFAWKFGTSKNGFPSVLLADKGKWVQS